MKKLFILPFVLLFFTGCSLMQSKESKPYVVMLSMDGFRWDYTDRVETPNFDKIAAKGVKAESLKPSFPSKTFPNHYSIATGLYPDHHGIVLNTFYDPATGREYSISDRKAVEDGYFYVGEPIWVTAEKQGVISGSFFWVGSEAKIDGYRPTFWKKYDSHITFGQRIDSVIAWLQKPEKVRPHLILWYMDEPDHTGHKAGPGSSAVDKVVMELDSLLGVFLTKLEKLPIAAEVNVIVTSDHGMENVSDDRKVVLSDHLPDEWVERVEGYNPNFNIQAKEGFKDYIYEALNYTDGISVWPSHEVPERLHYGTNPRTLDFVVVANKSWSVVENGEKKVGRGTHGFDNEDPDMQTIFYAYGPAFKENFVSPTFENVDIYPLLCEILGLEPAPVDGNIRHVEKLLQRH